MPKLWLTVGFGLMGLLASSVSLAAPGPHQHGCGHYGYHHGYYQGGGIPNYDPAAETTVSGIVGRIWTEDCLGCGCDGGTHVTLEAEGATYEAHLGPTCYLVGRGWELLRGERIEVTGVLLPYRGGGKALVVREMKRGNETLLLRDKAGVPLWSRGPCN